MLFEYPSLETMALTLELWKTKQCR